MKPYVFYEKYVGGSAQTDIWASEIAYRYDGSLITQKNDGSILMLSIGIGTTWMLRSIDGGQTFSIEATLAGDFAARGLAHHTANDEVLVLLDHAAGCSVYRCSGGSFTHRKTWAGAVGTDLSAVKTNWWTVTLNGSDMYVSKGITTTWYPVPGAYGSNNRVLSNAVDATAPLPIPSINWTRPLATGIMQHAAAVDFMAQISLAWGLNDNGELGQNDVDNRSSPAVVLGGLNFNMLSGGGGYSLGLENDGRAWAWGYGLNGRLGIGDVQDRSSPTLILGNHSFIQVSAGARFGTALKADGSVWAWGDNVNGELGTNSIVSRSSPVSVVGGHSFIQINCGYENALALKADGTAWGWGYNSTFALGNGTAVNKSSPVSVIGGHSFTQVATSGFNTLGLKQDGSVWAWGYDPVALSFRTSPVVVVGSHSFVQISVGGFFGYGYCLALKADGSAWAWGSNYIGRLGDGTTTGRTSPVLVLGSHSFVQIVANEGSLALKENGEMWAWGWNAYGQLGNLSTTNASSPVLVSRKLTT
ncbi:MAG: hypothetical protein Q8K86_05820 [Candidatus Nanopelagicaceae bacterium]|nr:hypothetical protein [Candidatus Nanopelagicaceae bacterium]